MVSAIAAMGALTASMPTMMNSTEPANLRDAARAAGVIWLGLSTQLMGDPAIARVDSRLTMKLVKSLH